jgi:apolipoprotein N-acyltransferase
LDAPLPRAVAETIYARVGDAPAFVVVALALLIVLRRRFAADESKI